MNLELLDMRVPELDKLVIPQVKLFFFKNIMYHFKVQTYNSFKILHKSNHSHANWTLEYLLLLNYKRNRFFPSIQTLGRLTYVTFSLGIISKFFNKGKSFIKNKINYIILANFLKKILFFSGIKQLYLFVKRLPVYLIEILHNLNNPVVANYKHPFNSSKVDESKFKEYFYFRYLLFVTTKPYGFVKGRKRGRVKRKIIKRVIKVNRLVD